MASEAPENPEQRPPTQNGEGDNRAPVDVPDPANPPATAAPESRLPARKDISLREFLHKIDDCAPIVRSLVPSPLRLVVG